MKSRCNTNYTNYTKPYYTKYISIFVTVITNPLPIYFFYCFFNIILFSFFLKYFQLSWPHFIVNPSTIMSALIHECSRASFSTGLDGKHPRFPAFVRVKRLRKFFTNKPSIFQHFQGHLLVQWCCRVLLVTCKFSAKEITISL